MSIVKYRKAKATVDNISTKYDIEHLRIAHNEYQSLHRKKNRSEAMDRDIKQYRDYATIYMRYLRAQKTMTKYSPTATTTNKLISPNSVTTSINARSRINTNFSDIRNVLTNRYIEHDGDIASFRNDINEETRESEVQQEQNFSNNEREDNNEELTHQENIDEVNDDDTINCQRNMSRICQNCKRHECSLGNRYSIHLELCQKNDLIKRMKFNFVNRHFGLFNNTNSEEQYLLCKQCKVYLTNCQDKVSKTYKNMWPSFYWYMLSDQSLTNNYGVKLWQLIPLKWRHWWLPAVQNLLIYSNVSLEFPSPIFVDKSDSYQEWKSSIESGSLGKLKDACNNLLIPTILCPWGCTEYCHNHGTFHVDILFQHMMRKSLWTLINEPKLINKIESARTDYLRENVSSYEDLLFNPNWKVLPSIIFNEDEAPMIVTCRQHNGGTVKKYIHPPRQPYHNLPCKYGDQLAHAIVKPRTIKPMKATKFVNTFQMHEQRGSFQGIDTCDITNIGDFSTTSVLLDQNESRTIMNRQDINVLLTSLQKQNVITEFTVNGFRERAKIACPSDNVIRSHLQGSTYVSSDDAMRIQQMIGEGQDIKIKLDDVSEEDENDEYTIVSCRRNWPAFIVFSQIVDYEGYGCNFPLIPCVKKQSISSQIIWSLSEMLTKVPLLWTLTDECIERTSQWHGWMLTYLSTRSFPSSTIYADTKNPFKRIFVKKFESLEEKLGLNGIDQFNKETMFELFINHPSVEVTDSINRIRENAAASNNIIIVVPNNHLVRPAPDTFCRGRHSFELVHVSLIWVESRSWRGCTYSRHGGPEYKSWWFSERNKYISVHHNHNSLSSIDWSRVHSLIYLKKKRVDFDRRKLDFLKYIGGQCHVVCKKHQLPLIVSKGKERNCCFKDSDSSYCNKVSFFKCPDNNCSVNLCKHCLKKCNVDIITSVEARDEQQILTDANCDEQEGDIDIEDISSSEIETVSSAEDSVISNDSLSDQYDQDNNIGVAIATTEEEDEENLFFPDEITRDEIDEFVTRSDMAEINEEDIIPESLPTTDSGDYAYIIEEELPKGTSINGHVILNQCGSILSRKDSTIEGYKYQKHFLQRIVSTTTATSNPLLYPEGMLFPSIFWKQMTHCGSIPGAIPSGLLTQETSLFGFETAKNMIRSRSITAASTTSTNPSYISFNYDLITNLACNRTHSKMIINRGLMCATNDTGLRIHGKNDSYLSGSMDSKLLVRKLCASQKYHQMTFFLTFTCNQAMHFGVKVIKNWVDSGAWKKYFRNWHLLKKIEQQEIIEAVTQASAGVLLRQWIEVKKAFISYLYSSPLSPYSPVDSIFVRDEYQTDQGNLFHIHLMLAIKMSELDEFQKKKIKDLIRASIVEVVRLDEVDKLIEEGIVKSWEDVLHIQELGKKILSHTCDKRCQMRIGPGLGPENFKCRKLNNLTVNPNCTKHYYMPLVKSRNGECIQRLIDIGLAEPITINEHGVASDFKSTEKIFHPARHIPPTNPNGDVNMSPVESKTFAACQSMQNCQYLHHTNGCNKYCCKYVVKVDENNVIDIKTRSSEAGALLLKSTFLHNTKITRSAMNEDLARNKKRLANKLTARGVAINQMLQSIIGEPEVHTDLNTVTICTLPLEFRTGYECTKKKQFYMKESVESPYIENDGLNSDFLCREIRNDLEFEEWRLHTDQEIMILQGVLGSKISVDKISLFSIRPPELRSLIDQPGLYFRWFHMKKNPLPYKSMEILLNKNLDDCAWIDALQHHILVRDTAFDEIETYIRVNNFLSSTDIAIRTTASQLSFIIGQHYMFSNSNEEFDEESVESWKYISDKFIYKEKERHLPTPVYSFIKPSQNIKFLLHIMLSLGHFTTEVDLILQPSIRDALTSAKLIGPERDEESLKQYSKDLLARFIREQLKYYPCSFLQMQRWVNTAGELFDSVIIRDEIAISDMPPALQTSLDTSYDDKVISAMDNMKRTLISAAFREIGNNVTLYNIPSPEHLMECTRDHPVIWNAEENYVQAPHQNISSFGEQKFAVTYACNTIDRYLDCSRQSTFTKNLVITGAPGSGKTYLLNYISLYAISRGMKVAITASMSQRAIQIGGLHLHKLFCIPVNKKLSLHVLAENAIATLLRNPIKLHILRQLNILFLDEIGQISTEFLALLDKILQFIRGNNIYMGGLLIISTLDHKQLQPVSGRPLLISAHILSCFRFILLKESVRAAGDPALQRIQNIVRMHPKAYKDNPELLTELSQLIKDNCTFVDSWNSPEICPGVFRLYGKKYPAKKASKEYIESVKAQLSVGEYRERKSEDIQKRNDSHQEWALATEHTMSILDNQIKEQRNLLFFIGALYQFTFNQDGSFSQSQLGLLLRLPSQNDLNSYRKIEILVAPPGLKWTMYDPSLSESDYIAKGWSKKLVGLSPDRSHKISNHIQAKRRQYGLKHHVTSTIHASMGDTLPKIATQISCSNSIWRLWDKAQIVVLLSRTKRANHIIFVGSKEATVKAIIELCKYSNQWTDHMEQILEMASVNYSSTTNVSIPAIRRDENPFRFCDRPLPTCNTGIVYMLVSVRNHAYTYIGMTKNISTRLQQHNSGNGHAFTTPNRLRPWALLAYIVGFDGNRSQMLAVERRWKTKRDLEYVRGVRCAKRIARLAHGLIDSYQSNSMLSYNSCDLRLVLNFRD